MHRAFVAAFVAACLIGAGPAAAADPPKPPPSKTDALVDAANAALNAHDSAKARRLMEQAAAGGEAEPLNGLATYIDNGIGAPADHGKAMALYEQAYRAGSKAAGLNLGRNLIESDKATDKAHGCALAGEVYGGAKEMKPYAASALGVCYLFGYGVERDVKRGMDLLDEYITADPQSKDARILYLLGRGYANGWGGRTRDLPRSYAYFLTAAELGHPRSMRYAGLALLDGEGVAKDPKAAFAWFTKSADAGDPLGEIDLAVMLAIGEDGVSFDPSRARILYAKAAEQGSAHALRGLGVMLLKGEGGGIERARGMAYLELASAGGDENAGKILAGEDPKLDRAEIDRIKAEWTARHGKPWAD
jgi:TPR repeat protein